MSDSTHCGKCGIEKRTENWHPLCDVCESMIAALSRLNYWIILETKDKAQQIK